jgi:hypothetical protein
MDYSVYVEAVGPQSAPPLDLEQLTDFSDRLFEVYGDVGGVVSGSVTPEQQRGWSARVRIAGVRSIRDAVTDAERLVLDAAQAAGLPAWPIVKLEAVEWEQLGTELQRSPGPELVGIAELAELADVSRQRASILARRAGFPDPLATLAAGPVWDLHAVRRFLKGWTRQVGRPAKQPRRGPVSDGEDFLSVWPAWRTYLLVDRELPPPSVLGYRSVLVDWVAFCEQEGDAWEQATPALLDRYLSHSGYPLGHSWRGDWRGDPLVPILEFYADAKRLKLIHQNPLEGVKPEHFTPAAERDLGSSQVAGSLPVRELDSPTALQRPR